jgi:hypothetical protein
MHVQYEFKNMLVADLETVKDRTSIKKQVRLYSERSYSFSKYLRDGLKQPLAFQNSLLLRRNMLFEITFGTSIFLKETQCQQIMKKILLEFEVFLVQVIGCP